MPVLVIARTFEGIPNSGGLEEISEKLGIQKIKSRKLHIVQITTNLNICQQSKAQFCKALDWMSEQKKNK